jgi:hypothetical protein
MALPVTVTPEVCPWGFNPANRSATVTETISHTLCEIENFFTTSTASIEQWMYDVADSLWNDLEWIWQQIGNGVAWGESKLNDFANAVAADAQSFWQWLQSEFGNWWPWLLGAGLILLGILFLPDIAVTADAAGTAMAAGAAYHTARSERRKKQRGD